MKYKLFALMFIILMFSACGTQGGNTGNAETAQIVSIQMEEQIASADGTEEESSDDIPQKDTVVYNAESGMLSFAGLNMQCKIPSEEVISKLEVEIESVEIDGEASTKTTIDHIYFKYKTEKGSSLMFVLSKREADAWDVPKEFGPMPEEICRSKDNEWVITHSVSALTAENPKESEEQDAFWEFISKNEAKIVKSAAFIE